MSEIGLEATYEDFPNGLCCGDCGSEIAWGERYSERFEGLMETALLPGEAVAEVSLVCVPCALKVVAGGRE